MPDEMPGLSGRRKARAGGVTTTRGVLLNIAVGAFWWNTISVLMDHDGAACLEFLHLGRRPTRPHKGGVSSSTPDPQQFQGPKECGRTVIHLPSDGTEEMFQVLRLRRDLQYVDPAPTPLPALWPDLLSPVLFQLGGRPCSLEQ